MKVFKDLLYNRDNQNLDISRLSSLLGVLTFLGASGWQAYQGEFDPTAFGIGWGGLCAGCGGWIYARQNHEKDGE